MHSSIVSIISILAAVSPAAADFKIYCGRDQNSLDGGGPGTECLFFNNPPSCDDVGNSIQHFVGSSNDASFSGVACDGCDISASPFDWDITRLEVHEGSDYFSGAGGDHWTIYKGDDGISFVDPDGNSLGSCTIPADPQHVDCSTPVSAGSLKNNFDCVSEIAYVESPN